MPLNFETDNFPFRKAKFFKQVNASEPAGAGWLSPLIQARIYFLCKANVASYH